MKKPLLSSFALVAVAALGWARPAAAQIIIGPINPPSWTNVFANSPNCPPDGNRCYADAAIPSFEVYDNYLGAGNILLEPFGRGGTGQPGYAPPFVCDASPSCGPGGSEPCCPGAIQNGMMPHQQTLTMDETGAVWWIDSRTHHVHYLLSGANADVDLDAALGQPGNQWASVAAGEPEVLGGGPGGPVGQVWAITPTGLIFALEGYIDISGRPFGLGWQQIPGMGAQISFMNETDPNALCGSDWHIPWVVDTAGAIWVYAPSDTYGCLALGSWSQIGTGLALAPNDFVLGGSTDNPTLYQWRRGNLVETVQPPLPPGVGIQTIGGGVDHYDVWITDTSHQVWRETCGTLGC